jgi:mannose-6-phosphate isomerase-like protein (cupin superfamily)
VRVDNLQQVESFITLDGSEIREVAGPASANAVNQSLAEATVQPGGATQEHFHRVTEESYLFTHGRGRMRLAPGMRHKVWNTADEPLRLLCCCAPAYSDDDTVITE